MQLSKDNRAVWFVLLALVIPVAGYGIMHALSYILASESGTGMNVLLTVIIIGLGLAVPYWMLKAGFHKAHISDRHEKDLTLKDMPKHQQPVRRQDLVND